jgi:serine protease inhibitor
MNQYTMANFDNKQSGFDNTDHKHNVKRRLMERQFDNNTQQSYQNDDTVDDYITVGEITGHVFNEDEIGTGMPFRPTNVDREKRRYDASPGDDDDIYNHQLDFNLYSKKSNINISYNDPLTHGSSPLSMKYSGINDDTVILKKDTLIQQVFASLCNNFTLDLVSKFFNNLKTKKTFALSPLNIFQLFGSLYVVSKGETEQELKHYFSFSSIQKDVIQNNLINLSKYINTVGIKYINLICMPDDINLNSSSIEYLSKSNNNIVTYNKNNVIQKINTIVYKNTGAINILNKDLINSRTNIILISSMNMNVIFKYGFDAKRTKNNMMIQESMPCNYYENEEIKLMEMDMMNDLFCFGVILSRSLLSHEKLEYYMTQTKETIMDLVSIPKFTTNSRFRIDNLFKKYGLKRIFETANLPELSPYGETTYISDIVHNATITVGEGNTNQKNHITPQNNKKMFIANVPFIYYIKCKPLNILIVSGFYNG